MRKMLIASAVLFMALSAKVSADPIGDYIKATLMERVGPVTQLGHGNVREAVVDSVILIGSYNGRSVLHLQGGFNRDSEVEDNAHLIYGAQLRLDPFVNARLNLPEGWELLRSLEHGPAIHYDTQRHGWYGYYQVGLAFGLQPKP